MSEAIKDTQLNIQELLNKISQSELERLIDKELLLDLKKPYKFRAVIYIRVSTPGQATLDKVSLQQQEKRIREFIKEHGWQFVEIYIDSGISGTKIDGRPDFQQLIADAANKKFDIVVGWITDRIGRNTDEMQALRKQLLELGVQVTSVEEPVPIKDPRTIRYQEFGFDKLMMYLLDFKAEQDNRTRSKRMDLGRRGKAEKGVIPCKTPYGYRKEIKYDESGRKKIYEKDHIVEEEATVIRMIFDRYDYDSWGIRKIAVFLNESKLPSPTGKTWGYSSVKYILQNPTYMGVVRWGWRLSKSKDSRTRLMQGHKGIMQAGDQDRIIDPDQFERVRQKLSMRKKLGGKAVASKGLLVGIAKCGRCLGGTYVTKYNHWFAYTKQEEERDKYTPTFAYLCSNYSQRGRSGCSARYVMSQGKLETLVIEEIRKLANSQQRRTSQVEELKKTNLSNMEKEIELCQSILEKITKRRQRQKYAYDNGIATLEEYIGDKKLNDIQETEINQKLTELRLKKQNEADIYRKITKSLDALIDFEAVWEVASFERRKELLSSILDKVIVHSDQIELIFAVSEQESLV